jgi:ABC-type amino acid transport substrate-binding protein
MRKMSVTMVLSVGMVLLAGSRLGASPENEALRIGTNHWPFWRIIDNNVPSGADLDIWSEMARRVGLSCEFEVMTHPEYLDGLASGSIDGAVSLVRTAEREETMIFLDPPFRTKQKFACYVRQGEGPRLRCFDDFHALKVGTSWPSTFVRLDQDKSIEKRHDWDVEAQFERLAQGQLDVLVAVEWQGDYYLQHAANADRFEKVSYGHKEYHPVHLVMSRKSRLLDRREQLEEALAGMVEDGTVKAIVDRYLPGWYEPYEKPFSLVCLPACYQNPVMLARQIAWIRAHQAQEDIAFVIHTGDMVREGTDAEWQHVDQCFRELDGVVPYAIATGNHDVFPGQGIPRDRNCAQFDRFFPMQRRQNNPFCVGHLASGAENMVFEFRHGASRFLLLVLEFGVRDAALDWAQEVVQQHRDWPTIVVTHAFTLGPDSGNNFSWHPSHLDRSHNDRGEIWEKLIRKHPNIVLVLSAHYKGLRRESSLGDAGNLVHEVLTGLVEEEMEQGWLRVLTFYPEQNKIRFETYSPVSDTYQRDASHQFEIECPLMAM